MILLLLESRKTLEVACFVGEFLIITRGFKFSEREGETVEGRAQERLKLSDGIIRNYLKKITKIENAGE